MIPINLLFLKRSLAASIVFASSLLLPCANAASVNWGATQNITGDSNVSTNGVLIGAFNVGDVGVPSTTVNGVTFQSFQAPNGNGTSGNFTTTGGGGSFASNTAAGSPNPPFSALSAAYQTLLMSRVTPLFSPLTLTISGLLIGMQYQFQFWANDSSSPNHFIDATAGNSVRLFTNPSSNSGGLGQWVIGSFTADAVTQSIRFLGDGDGGVLNGFQLRQIPAGPNAVPDSGITFALLSLASGGIALAGRKLRRAELV